MLATFLVFLSAVCWINAFHGKQYAWSASLRPTSLRKALNMQVSAMSDGAVIVRGSDLTKSYTGTVAQFEKISLNVVKGQRAAVVGVNGAGKSTLMKVIAGLESPDAGQVEKAQGLRISYVEQDPSYSKGTLVHECVFGGKTPQAEAVRRYLRASQPAAMEADFDAFTAATEGMEDASAWDYEAQGQEIASSLGVGGDFLLREVQGLSGGETKRVALAAALLEEPELLLLDEPTNHLDMDALEWLADFLKPGKFKDMSILLVTHDRYFLQRVCKEIFELDRGLIHRYDCDYSTYLEQKAARLAAEDAEADRARTKVGLLRSFIIYETLPPACFFDTCAHLLCLPRNPSFIH
jgi:ATP-binding cassette subfamily F protein uup